MAIIFTASEAETRAWEIAGESQQKYGQYSSPHEILGVIVEEFRELEQACHQNAWVSFREELLDIAAVCLRGASETTTREESGQA